MDWLLDVFATWLYGLKVIAITLAVIMFISGLDDFFIDVVYWVRRIKRKLSVYRRYPRMSYRELYKPDEKPLAIMVPAWNETGVIGNMAELAATTLDYENYHIFVGTYPNDPDTQRDVDEVCARFPNVHKVVCARPGPTSKADCLNNVLDAITQFERSANFAFAGFILHDAEDVISPMELRLFNYLVERKDLIQIPVYPFEREWTHFTSMTYIDEFSELHGKDVPVREALAGQVPSAGVGTCFSRRAVTALLADGDGIAFDVQSLTEDYDIGFRLKEKGMTEIFVRFPVVDEAKEREQRKFLQHARTSNMICVREYFPDTFSTAVRQKSRWIIGIVFQGFKTHKWTSSLTLNYFLWRDRKGAISNFVSFLAMLVMIQLLLLLAYESLWPDAWHFLSIFSGSAWLMTLLWLNFGLMVNRIVQRVIFVTGYYGLTQGLLSVLRLFWGNLINFMANWRALKQVLQHGDPRRVAWDKTTHDFPSVTGDTRSLRPLGQILLENQVITEEQLDTALRNRVEGLRLGGSMLMQGLISANPVQALANYTVQFADNRQYVVGATLPVLLKEGQYDAAQKLLATLPANEMLEERYAVSVATRNKAEALRLARLLYQQEPANLTRLDQLTWQLMQNEQSREAADLLLQRYPFQGDARVSQTLMARLASLLESHPYLATPAKVAILSKPLPLAEQRQWQSQLPGIADNCPAIVRLLGDMSPSYDAAAWNRLAKCYRDTLPGVALYAWLQAEQRQPNAWQHRAVAYQAYQVEDYATALAAW